MSLFGIGMLFVLSIPPMTWGIVATDSMKIAKDSLAYPGLRLGKWVAERAESQSNSPATVEPAAFQKQLDSLFDQGYWLAQGLEPDSGTASHHLNPGPLFRMVSFRLELEPSMPSLATTLQEQLNQSLGLRASRENWEAMRASLEKIFRNRGYPLARMSLSAESQPLMVGAADLPENLHLVLKVWPNKGYKFGGWTAQGSRTTAETLEKLSLLEYGETFDETRVALALSRLRRTGYFSTVDSIGLVRDSQRNLVYPLLKLSDDAGNRIGGLLGYDSEAKQDALSGFLDIHLVNIRGTARDFDFNFDSRPESNGHSDRQVRFQYLEPWLPGLPIGLKVSGSIWLQDSLYDQMDGAVALLHDLDMHSRLEITFSKQWSLDRLTQTESQATAGGLGLLLDHRNQVPFPSRGYHLEIRSQGIRRELSDSSRYLVQTQLKAQGYWPLVSRLLFHGSAESGGNWPRHPLAMRGDRFDVGGARSLRGYREREFSTDLYGFTQIEIQWLLAGQGRVLGFLSPGLIDKTTPSLWWTPVLGYGVGLEIGSKAWAIGLLYALNPDRSWGQGLLHMTVDNRF